MSTPKCPGLLLFLCCIPILVEAQENIPIGIFRLHVSYNAIHDIAFDGVARTFAAAPHGILIVDRQHGETATYSKANGLSGGTITNVEFDVGTRKLLVAYAEGYFDILDDTPAALQFDPAAISSVSGSRRINQITVDDNRAYLASDYGVVVFDLVRNQVRETWRDLGISGETLPVQHSVVTTDSIFLSTAQGVMAGRLTDNLQDFRKWKRYVQWPFSNHVSGLAIWHDAVYAAVDHAGIFRCTNGAWTEVSGFPVDRYFSLQASKELLVSASTGIYRADAAGSTSRISSPLYAAPRFAIADENGAYWIGDQEAGLLTNADGAFASLLPQCPANDTVTQIRYSAGKIFAVGGDRDDKGIPLRRRGVVDVFDQGRWTPVSLPAQDLTDVVWQESAQTLTAASYGYGVVVKSPGSEPVVYGEANSTLRSISSDEGVLVTSLAQAPDGILAMNYAVTPELHLMDAGGGWASFSAGPAAHFGQKIAIDGGDNVWMTIDPAKGGGLVVFNRSSGKSTRLTDLPGHGALPSQSVHSLCLDRTGAMWIGTASGVAYFPNASSILQSPVDAIKPIVDGRFVLRDDAVTAIAVDGGNRKWFGTRRGVWLYNALVDETIVHFNDANSVLPSDHIIELEIHQQSGEVFMATQKGLASFRAGATEPGTSTSVKIFPNPVDATFTGTVGIAGTPADAVVKITDAAGKLVWETRANGSMATWNLFDDRGRRVPSGVYIVFTVSDDGKQQEAGKLAVIN